MFTESARLYDIIYGAFKDYADEAARLAEKIRAAHPGARTVLDVACGTGEHVRHLRTSHGFEVDGLDIDAGLLEVARQKVPEARFLMADMSDFQLDRVYDAVVCLFSSIGYLETHDRVTAALDGFRRHLAPGGVVIVEPWFAPGALTDGATFTKTAESEGLRVERTSLMRIEGRISTILFRYRIEEGDSVRFAEETHRLGLFTTAEMAACFEKAGLKAVHDPVGLTDRGLFVAQSSL